MKTSNSGDGPIAKGKLSTHENGGKARCKSKSKTRDGKVVNSFICYHCNKECHIRKYFPLRQRSGTIDRPSGSSKRSDGLSISSEASLVEDGYESSEVLMVSSSVDNCEWILDSGCSFHMTPNCLWFQ